MAAIVLQIAANPPPDIATFEQTSQAVSSRGPFNAPCRVRVFRPSQPALWQFL